MAALLFLIPRSMRIGAYGLLAILGVGFVAHAVRGEHAADLRVYLAAVYFVLVHVPVGSRTA